MATKENEGFLSFLKRIRDSYTFEATNLIELNYITNSQNPPAFFNFRKEYFYENTVFLNDITKEEQRILINWGINKFNLYKELVYGFNFFGHFNIQDQDDMWWEKYVKLRIGFQITEQNSIILYATSLPMEQ